MGLLMKNMVVAAKVESALGTAESLTTTEAVFFIADMALNVGADEVERYAAGSSSPLTQIIGAREISMTLTVEIHGKGEAGSPAWASVLLAACGMYDDSNTWKLATATPATSGNVGRTITVGTYINGIRFLMCGCMGNARFVLENGKPPRLVCELRGKYSAVADVAQVASSLPSVTPPRCSNMTLTWDSWTPRVNRLEIDLQNQVELLEDVSSTGGDAGFAYAIIESRRPVIRIEPEAVLVATKDIFGTWLAQSSGAFNCDVGGATWNKIEFDAPAAQITEPDLGDRAGLATFPLQLLCTRSAADDDELTIAFTSGA